MVFLLGQSTSGWSPKTKIDKELRICANIMDVLHLKIHIISAINRAPYAITIMRKIASGKAHFRINSISDDLKC